MDAFDPDRPADGPAPRRPARWQDARWWPSRRTLVRTVLIGVPIVAAAALAFPNLYSARINWNDVAAYCTMRTISNAQLRFRSGVRLDVDGDAETEYGSLGELSGAVALRGSDRALHPPLLSGAFRTLDSDGTVRRSGYRFAVYLRRRDGVWVAADPSCGGPAPRGPTDAFVCYAWPSRHGASGTPTFAVDAAGVVVRTDDWTYSGRCRPSPTAAPGVGTGVRAGQGGDGNTWVAGPPRH